MSKPRRVLLTPLAISGDQGHFVCIAIRDLVEKAGISLEEAQRITSTNSVHSFQAAQDAADGRLAKD